jgi:hypothetical protein
MLHNHGTEKKEGLIDGAIGAKCTYDLAVGVDGEHGRSVGGVLKGSQHGQGAVDATKSIVGGTGTISQGTDNAAVSQTRGDGVSLFGHVLQNLTSRLGGTGSVETIGGTCLEDGNVCFLGDALLGGDISLLQLLEAAGRRLPLAKRSQLVGLLDKGLVFKVGVTLVAEFDIIWNTVLRKREEGTNE